MSAIAKIVDWTRGRGVGLGSLISVACSPSATIALGGAVFGRTRSWPGTKNFRLADCRNILVVRLDEIGDVVLSSPFLRELRANAPSAWITLVVKPANRNLVEKCPYVNETLEFDCRLRWSRFAPMRLHWRALRLAARSLWKRRFDLAINPRREGDYYHGNALAYLSGARARVGYVDPQRRTGSLDSPDAYLNWKLDGALGRHEVEQDLAVLTTIGGSVRDKSTEVWVDSDDDRHAAQILADNGVSPDEALIAVAAGATLPRRRWPAENYRKLAERIVDRIGCRCVITGGPEDRDLGVSITEGLGDRVVNLVGQTTIRQTAAIFKRCREFVGNNSGPLHLACAAGTPVVEVSACNRDATPSCIISPVRFGPWGSRSVVLQPEKSLPPCVDGCIADSAHCITQIGVDEALSAVESLLDLPPERNDRLKPGLPDRDANEEYRRILS